MNDEVLSVLREYNPELSETIKEKKFYFHNREWIESMNAYEKNLMDMHGI
jgi:hypothetical protein